MAIITSEQHASIKAAAAQRRLSMKDYILEAVEMYEAAQTGRRVAALVKATGEEGERIEPGEADNV